MSIVFSRVDGRMIHGQIAIAWTRLLQIDEILVVNDKIAEDDTQKMLLELAVPSGIDLSVCSIDEAVSMIENDELGGTRTMIVYKELNDAIKCIEKGLSISSLNIGGMYYKEGKKQYAKALCLDDNDAANIMKLINKGIEVFYQIAPMNEKEDIRKYLSL